MRINKLSKFSNEDIIEILKKAKSFSDVLRSLGYNSITTGNYKIVKNELNKRNIEIPIYNYFSRYNNFNRRRTIEELFNENSNVSRAHLKKIIIKDSLIKYECECGNTGEWRNQKLILQLEHKNGIATDNRLENLCFLCPNCHSQTETFSGKNAKKFKKEYKRENREYKKTTKNKKCKCGNLIANTSKKCVYCYSESNRKVIRPSKEILLQELEEMSQNAVAKKYNVSWHTITKWIIYYKKAE